jgi:single-stranded-DNA-specific exonuclease
LLDLVALGTVADLAPLVGENRALVRAGLLQIRQPRRQGLRSLIGAAGLKPERITATDIGFALGPRLNAAGRLQSALDAYDLLTTSDVQEAGRLAQQLDKQNRERQDITRQMQYQAEQLAIQGDQAPLMIFAASPDFNPGVVGLVASRLTEVYYRPALVAHQGEEFTRGSCRSIAEFHITDALDQCADLLEHHGGHAAAAGFTIRTERLSAFLERMNAITQAQIAGLDLRPTLFADAELPLSELTPDLLEWLDWLQPTGYGNPQAVFASRGVRVVNARAVGKDSSHLKLTVSDGRVYYDAIAFRQGHWLGKLPPFVDLMYTFETNEYNGRVSLQLNIRDIGIT